MLSLQGGLSLFSQFRKKARNISTADCAVYLPPFHDIQINVTGWCLALREDDKALFILGQ